jgi:hypothetical protein
VSSTRAPKPSGWGSGPLATAPRADPGGWLAPGREAGEQWQAVIRGAGRDEIDQRDLADPGLLIGRGRARDRAHQAWVSPQRVVFAAQRDRLDEWTRDLPSRLSRIVRRAQDAKPGTVSLPTKCPRPADRHS